MAEEGGFLARCSARPVSIPYRFGGRGGKEEGKEGRKGGRKEGKNSQPTSPPSSHHINRRDHINHKPPLLMPQRAHPRHENQRRQHQFPRLPSPSPAPTPIYHSTEDGQGQGREEELGEERSEVRVCRGDSPFGGVGVEDVEGEGGEFGPEGVLEVEVGVEEEG